MEQEDTVRLLKECDAGVKMGVASIDDVEGYVKDRELREYLRRSRKEHEALGSEVQNLLGRCHEEGKDPNPVAKGMSWMKTTMKMGWTPSDRSVADLITDGCDMGVKSLNRYLNEYAAADEDAQNVCRRLIGLEERMGQEMRRYL